MISISKSEHKLEIDLELGARACSWTISGVELLAAVRPNNHPIMGGWYLMAPWVGRIKDAQIDFQDRTYKQETNFEKWAIHGTSPFTAYEVVELSANRLVAEQRTSEQWPVPATIQQIWHVHEWGIETTATVSTPVGQFPAALGWHPWFRRQLKQGETAVYEMNATERFIVDEDFIITGDTTEIGDGPFDDSFRVPDGKAFIRWENFGELQISTNVEFIHLYEATNHVCIEPETSPPNGINLLDRGLGHIVTPTQPLVAHAEWRFQRG